MGPATLPQQPSEWLSPGSSKPCWDNWKIRSPTFPLRSAPTPPHPPAPVLRIGWRRQASKERPAGSGASALHRRSAVATMGARLPLFLLLTLLGSSQGAGEAAGLDTGALWPEVEKGSWRDRGTGS